MFLARVVIEKKARLNNIVTLGWSSRPDTEVIELKVPKLGKGSFQFSLSLLNIVLRLFQVS